MLTYRDAYLARFCTQELETIATEDVQILGTFSQEWEDKLVVLRCYILACLENQADGEDLFTAKYKTYSKEFDGMLAMARANTPDDSGNILPIFGIPMERA